MKVKERGKETTVWFRTGRFALLVWAALLFPEARGAASPSLPLSPRVKGFTVADYPGGNQNWSVGQDGDGILYFGNNRGLLRYDGARWQLDPLPTERTVRSVYAAPDNRIYVGSFEEFGYFETDTNNRPAYRSLSDSLGDFSLCNDEIWRIIPFGDRIFFQSFNSYFIYDGKRVTGSRSEHEPLYFHKVGTDLYAQMINEGLFRYDGERFVPMLPRQLFGDDDIVAVFAYPDEQPQKSGDTASLLMISSRNGIFLYENGAVRPFRTDRDEALKAAVANRAVVTSDSLIVVGTLSDGLYAFSREGKQVWHINKRKQLPNNTVLGLWCTPDDNIWCALDNGVALIRNNAHLWFYTPEAPDLGMVYDMAIRNNDFYFASNHGLYRLPDGAGQPEAVHPIDGQTWHITDFDGQLICGNNRGSSTVSGAEARPLQEETGGTCIRKAILHGKEILLQSTYAELIVFDKDETGTWQYSHRIDGFSHPVRTLEIDPSGNIWASQMHKGIYRLTLKEDLSAVDEAEYIAQLDSSVPARNINVMKLRGRTIFSDGIRFYIYEDLKQRILPFDKLNEELPDIADTYRIVPINNDLYWFIRNTEYLLVRHQKGSYRIQKRIPFSSFDNPVIENEGNIYVSPDGDSYFCLDGGVAKYRHTTTPAKGRKPQLSLASVSTYYTDGEGEKQQVEARPDEPGAFGAKQNSLQFRLAYPDFSGETFRVRYTLQRNAEPAQVDYLNGFGKRYGNLPAGNYHFTATAENNVGNELGTVSYRFAIAAPAYRSAPALIIYALLFVLLLRIVIRARIAFTLRKRERVFTLEQERQQRKLNEQEKLIAELQKKKLESELSFKGKELATIAMESINRKEFLEELRRELQQQIAGGSVSRKTLERLVGQIGEQVSSNEDEWAVFQRNFDLIHANFFRNLREKYPDLTPTDLRFCALLRLNMSTKEMARTSNLSVRGIEAARYRLRKKLSVPDGKSLVDFMIEFR